MPNSNQNSKPFLIFPENSALIIADILKKYNLEESNKELLEKWGEGKKGLGAILADLVIKMVGADLSIPELANLVQKELNISSQKAQKIIEDLNEKIIAPALQVPKKIPSIGKLLSLEE